MLACADIEEGIVLRRAGVRVPILVFGALGISDLHGVFEHYLTPTISTPSAARALQAAAAKTRRDPALSPQDRHRDEPARVPPRQPPADAPGRRRQPQPVDRRDLHALRHRGRAGESRVRRAARALRSRVRDADLDWHHRSRAARRQQRGALARRARLVRLRQARPAALRHRPPAARVDAGAATCPVTPQSYRAREGAAAR